MLKKRHKSWGLWGGCKRGMHAQNMDTTEASHSPPPGEIINGPPIATSATGTPPPKPVIRPIDSPPKKDPQADGPVAPSFQSFPFAFTSATPPTPAACTPTSMYVPKTMPNQGQVQISVPNSLLPHISAMLYKQEQQFNQQNAPFIASQGHAPPNLIPQHPMPLALPQFPPNVVKESPIQGPFKPFVNPATCGQPVPPVNGMPRQGINGNAGTPPPGTFPPIKPGTVFPKIVEEEPMDVRITPAKQPTQNGPENSDVAKQTSEKRPPAEEKPTDADMDAKDLTFRVNIVVPDKNERERPMSWTGDLSESESLTPKCEEHMRLDDEMEPMSPMSAHSDTDQDNPVQVKCENPLEDHNFSRQRLRETDSPVATRSDSGCELQPGPFTPTQSPLLPRITSHQYSPNQSPGPGRHMSGFSSPYSHTSSTGLSRNGSDASQYGGSFTSFSSAPSPISSTQYSPSQSPNMGRIVASYGGAPIIPVKYGGLPLDMRDPNVALGVHVDCGKDLKDDDRLSSDINQHSVLTTQSGITRQQLINSPCPICEDKISGFHYGIFSCESCKGFFKRTVQNKKNYHCIRGANCEVSITTRKKCPACRFDKCLRKGMKLEAIREDRTRGGRSTYQCTPYTLAPPMVSPSSSGISLDHSRMSDSASVKSEPHEDDSHSSSLKDKPPVPMLLQQIYKVEHLCHCSEDEITNLRQAENNANSMETEPTDPESTICKFSENRLYKLVKWCKSLPPLRNISIDDRIILLMNSYWELVLLSCCYRSVESPGKILVTSGKTITQDQANAMGIGPCVERMLNLSYQLRRLKVDQYEYMAMKVIVLLTSDVAGLSDGEKVRFSQERVVQALQEYTLTNYPGLPSKFGELLLRIPELQRTCHVSKEMLSVKKKEDNVNSSEFLFELLKSDL